jgi:hypothetical protein
MAGLRPTASEDRSRNDMQLHRRYGSERQPFLLHEWPPDQSRHVLKGNDLLATVP